MDQTPGEPAPNAKTLKITLRCSHCGHKFPSPIFMDPYSVFKSGTIIGYKEECPACGKWSDCGKENFLALFEGGGWVGNAALVDP